MVRESLVKYSISTVYLEVVPAEDKFKCLQGIQLILSCVLLKHFLLHSLGKLNSTREIRVSFKITHTRSHSAKFSAARARPFEYLLPDDVHDLKPPAREEDLLWCPRILSRGGHVSPAILDDEQPLFRGGK